MSNEVLTLKAYYDDWNDYDENVAVAVLNKRSSNNAVKTINYLEKLYNFKSQDVHAVIFKGLLKIASPNEVPLLCLSYAYKYDLLIQNLAEKVLGTLEGSQVQTSLVAQWVNDYYKGTLKETTAISTAQNILSSFKQGGFILGKMKNIRVRPDVTWLHVVNAVALDYQDGLRGNMLFDGPSLKFLQLDERKIRQLIQEGVMELYLNFAETGHVILLEPGAKLQLL
jgi:hypothetical protein